MSDFQSTKKYYAGIGSRQTPGNICDIMMQIAVWLERRDYILRSGGASGADAAFAFPVKKSEIYIPWIGFNGHNTTPPIKAEDYKAAEIIAEKFHPAWNRCSPSARRLHTRNVFQVLGADLKTSSEFVVCWTVDGGATGGTGQALRIAAKHKIPIFNLFDVSMTKSLRDYVMSACAQQKAAANNTAKIEDIRK